MLGFVVAMEKECGIFLSMAENIQDEFIAGKHIYRGIFENNEFVVVVSGIGKVSAGMSTQLLIDKFNPSRIINFGVAGGKEGSGLNAGDIVLLDKVCQYDFDLSEIDNVEIGYNQDYDIIYFPTDYFSYKGKEFKVRTGATGDRFTKNKLYIDIIHNLKAQVVDMESCAIAQVCYANSVSFNSLKLISDVDGEKESIFSQYANNIKSVCDKIPQAIKELINNL